MFAYAHLILAFGVTHVFSAPVANVASSIQLTAPASAPDDAFEVDPTYVGFACEETSFYAYAGPEGDPNTFSQNLIDEVAKRTNVKPVIRVGGTSLDYSKWDGNQKEALNVPNSQKGLNIPKGVTIGPSYFQSFKNIDAQYILDIPLAPDNLTQTLDFVDKGTQVIGSNNILAIEIGNEPNAYANNGLRSDNWSPATYAQQWMQYSTAVSKQLGISEGSTMYQALAMATRDREPGEARVSDWTLNRLFNAGWDQMQQRIKTMSMHYYQTHANPPSSVDLQRDLMNHTAIVTNMTFFDPYLSYLSQNYPDIPLVLGEVGSAINGPDNDFAFESVLGSALWQVDFMLYGMTKGIHRMNIQLGLGFGYAMWQPVQLGNKPPQVNAPYYAQIFAADFLGPNGNVKVSNIDLNSDMYSAYAAFEDNSLKRLVIVNLMEWTGSGQRPSATVQLNLPKGYSVASVDRLTSPSGATTSKAADITWAGYSWTYESKGRAVKSSDDGQKLRVRQDGTQVEVPASSAIMISLS